MLDQTASASTPNPSASTTALDSGRVSPPHHRSPPYTTVTGAGLTICCWLRCYMLASEFPATGWGVVRAKHETLRDGDCPPTPADTSACC